MDKTGRTILLESGNKGSFILMAVIFLINGIVYLMNGHMEGYRLLLGAAMIAAGIFHAFYSALAFSENSKYSSKVRVDDKLIELKSSFWKRTLLIKWADVKRIHFTNGKVKFELANGTKAFPYGTKSKKSKQLKNMLGEFAELLRIQVIGG